MVDKIENDPLGGPSDSASAQSLSDQLLALKSDMETMKQRLAWIERQLISAARAEPIPGATREASVEKSVPPPAWRPPLVPEPAQDVPAVQADPAAALLPSAWTEDAGQEPAPVAKPTPRLPPPVPVPVPPRPSAAPKRPARRSLPPAVTAFIQQWVIGGNHLVKVGVLILFLGLGFALRYAASSGFFPMWARYAAVGAVGVVLLVMGWRLRGREDHFGLVLQGGGIGVLYLTTLAAMKLQPLLPTEVGFLLLVLVAVLAGFLAVREDAVVLAVVAALGGFAAPVLASTGSGNHVVLFSYLTVLNLGIVGIAWFKSWRSLNVIGYVCSFGLGTAWAGQHYRPALFGSTEPFLLLLFGLYVLITVLFARRSLITSADDPGGGAEIRSGRTASRVNYVDGGLAFGVPFSAFWLQQLLVEPYPYGAAISAIGFSAFYLLLAWLLGRVQQQRYALLTEVLVALGLIFGTLAIPLLETPWTAAAWAVEAAGVYWVGSRQQQWATRLFALLVLFASAVRFLPELQLAPSGTVLEGPLLSALLLTGSAFFTHWLMWRAAPGRLHDYETALRPFVAGLGALALAVVPMLLLPLDWASPVLALLGAALIFFAVRMSARPLLLAGWVYQLAGGLLFLTTLEPGSGDAVLISGWTGLLATCLVGVAMWIGVLAIAPGAGPDEADGAPGAGLPLDTATTVMRLAGLSFINLAPLFVLSWQVSAMVWPLIGLGSLMWAVRTRQHGVMLYSLGLQVVAGVAHLGSWTIGDWIPSLAPPRAAFINSGFLGPLIIALAALVCAWLMQRGDANTPSDKRLGWLALGWGGLWWAFAWVIELARLLTGPSVPAALVGVTLATACALALLSRGLRWAQLGQAVLAYVPVLVLLAAHTLTTSAHPLEGWGALAWPAALLIHAVLMRRLWAPQPPRPLNWAHVVGAWLFVVLVSVEAHWWLERWSPPGTVWPLLGAMLIPALYVWSMSRPSVIGRWPVRDHSDAYVLVSACPLVVYLLAWVWVSNVLSDGDPRPLPYLPLLNPLELGYVAVLLVVALWWRSVRTRAWPADLGRIARPLLAATAFAGLTGGVIRTCHHWVGIPWQADALIASDTVQTALSVVWGITAITLMLLGNRRHQRIVWTSGAALVTVVVAKLFLVELAASGTLQRIVSFIGVGLMLLIVGYLAPLPPRKAVASDSAPSDGAAVGE